MCRLTNLGDSLAIKQLDDHGGRNDCVEAVGAGETFRSSDEHGTPPTHAPDHTNGSECREHDERQFENVILNFSTNAKSAGGSGGRPDDEESSALTAKLANRQGQQEPDSRSGIRLDFRTALRRPALQAS